MNCSLSRLVGRLVQIGIDRKEVLDDRRALDLGTEILPAALVDPLATLT